MKKLLLILALILLGAGLLIFLIKSQTSPTTPTTLPIPISYQQVQKDPEIKTVIDSSKKINGNLEVSFHHNSNKEEPISISGAVNYKLSKTSASPGEKITLTVYNWTSEYFEIKIGAKSDQFAFGKKAESLDNDEPVLKELQRQGINKADVVLEQDYAPRGHSSPYSKTYRDTKSGKRIMVSQGLPMVTEDGAPIDVGWTQQGNKFVEKNNLFKATVQGTSVELKVKNDQPFDSAQGGPAGRKKNDKLSFHAQLFLNNVEQTPTGPVLLAIDPVNPNYENNVLEWDYGIAKRRLRLIEGNVLGSWVFTANPNGEVRIKYNQVGDYKLKLGQYKFNDDEERVTIEQFNNLTIEQYPFEVSDSATYYPDPDPENTSVDGSVGRQSVYEDFATIIAGAGNSAVPSGSNYWLRIVAWAITDQWTSIYRIIAVFDTSGLPDTAVISAATLSWRGNSKFDDLGWTPNVNIYAATPASNTDLVNADYGQTGGASPTALATPISYAELNAAAYTDFTLNSAGLAAISVTGVSKFSARNANYDVAATPPTWGNSAAFGYNVYGSEAGTGYKPKLVVTYTMPLGSACTVDGDCNAGLICRNSVCCKSTIAAGDSCAVYYPDAHPESTSVDGKVDRSSDGTWDSLVTGAGTLANDSATGDYAIYMSASATTNTYNTIRRSIFLFDSSGLPDTATVTAATLSLYGWLKVDGLNTTPDINIYTSTPTSPTALVAADYGQTGGATPTPFCDTPITYAGWSTSGYNDFAFNTSGIAAIKKTAADPITKFSARNANRDVANSAPAWSDSNFSGLAVYWAEQGTGYKPRLYVEYSEPPTPTPTPTPTPFPMMNFEGVDMQGVNIN